MSATHTEKSFSSSQSTIVVQSASNKSLDNSKHVSILQRILWLGNLLYYQVVATLTVVMLWVFFDNTEWTSAMVWHMVLCTAAYVPLMALAIISFSKDNLPTLYMRRKKIYLIHGILLFVSCAAVTIGISLEINSKNKRKAQHFQSTHAILGLTSWILVICEVFIGIMAANTQVFAQYVKPVAAKLIHNFLGISAFVLGVTSIMVMYKSHHYKANLSSSAYYASYYAAGYIVIWSVSAALRSLYFQVKGVVS